MTGGSSGQEAAPPSYEQALQHRRIEGSYNAHHFPRDGAYPGPPRPIPPRTHSGRSRRFQLPSTNFSRSISPIVVREDDTVSRASSLDLRNQTCMKLALPPMHMCMAITCLILNICTPGIGTLLAAFGIFCCTKSEYWSVREKFRGCGYSLLIGLGQIVLLPVILLGWIWSIMWGFALLGVSLDTYHGTKDDDDEESPPSTSQDNTASGGHHTSTQTHSPRCSITSSEDIESGRVSDDPDDVETRTTISRCTNDSSFVEDETVEELAQVHEPRVPSEAQGPSTSDALSTPRGTVETVVVVSENSANRHTSREVQESLPSEPPSYEFATGTLTGVTT